MEKKEYSWRTFKWGMFFRKVCLPLIALTVVFTVLVDQANKPSWASAPEEMVEKHNLEKIDVYVEKGDSYWSIQERLIPGSDMWVLHDAFIALNPHYNGRDLQADEIYTFLLKKKKK